MNLAEVGILSHSVGPFKFRPFVRIRSSGRYIRHDHRAIVCNGNLGVNRHDRPLCVFPADGMRRRHLQAFGLVIAEVTMIET